MKMFCMDWCLEEKDIEAATGVRESRKGIREVDFCLKLLWNVLQDFC